ncbi:MAG TPA: glycosyltransferase [Candidatus Paceibacterota bacterium]|nr:glycosyltransferase [Candidatus Paceibacterota bacterium]
MKKKILIFTLAYYPKFIGGDAVAIKEKTDRIDDIEFHMVTLRFDRSLPRVEKVGNVLVHRIGWSKRGIAIGDLKKFPWKYVKYIFQIAAGFKALSLHRRYRYDATWAMMAHSAGIPAGLFNLFAPRVPLVLELQEGDPLEYIERTVRPLWPLFSRAFTHARIVSAISTFLGAWARRRGFQGDLEIVPNGVDCAKFASPHDRFAVRKALDIREDETVLITSSRLVHKNAIDDVIRALPHLPGVQFLILGIGPDEAMLKSLARELGVESRAHFLGQISHQELPAYLQASTIFIRPSRSEGFGNSFVEAMAAGVPVIATQEGGIADFLFDAKRNPEKPTTGWAVDKDSPGQIVFAVKDILSNPGQARKVIEVAKKLAFEKYDWDMIAQDMREKVFARVL